MMMMDNEISSLNGLPFEDQQQVFENYIRRKEEDATTVAVASSSAAGMVLGSQMVLEPCVHNPVWAEYGDAGVHTVEEEGFRIHRQQQQQLLLQDSDMDDVFYALINGPDACSALEDRWENIDTWFLYSSTNVQCGSHQGPRSLLQRGLSRLVQQRRERRLLCGLRPHLARHLSGRRHHRCLRLQRGPLRGGLRRVASRRARLRLLSGLLRDVGGGRRGDGGHVVAAVHGGGRRGGSHLGCGREEGDYAWEDEEEDDKEVKTDPVQ